MSATLTAMACRLSACGSAITNASEIDTGRDSKMQKSYVLARGRVVDNNRLLSRLFVV